MGCPLRLSTVTTSILLSGKESVNTLKRVETRKCSAVRAVAASGTICSIYMPNSSGTWHFKTIRCKLLNSSPSFPLLLSEDFSSKWVADNLRNIRESVLQPYLNVSTQESVYPGDSLELNVGYRNLKGFTLNLYRTNLSEDFSSKWVADNLREIGRAHV